MKISDNFIEAATDYRYLTERGYPPRGFLLLVGNRYSLSDAERTILYRGIAPEQKNRNRRKKMILPEETGQLPMHIDGFNVLVTLASYLSGKPVFLSTDGILRDAAALRGKLSFTAKTAEAIVLLEKYLEKFKSEKYIYLDKKVDFHQRVIDHFGRWPKVKRNISFIVSSSVDKELSELTAGVAATSDSEIIDATGARIFDMTRHLLEEKFNPGFFDLADVFRSVK